MWYLVDSDGDRCYLTPNKTVRIGRKVGELILEDDPTISRQHASIYVRSTTKGKRPISTCTIKDLNSKYGTWVQKGEERIRVSANGYNLMNRDRIHFGVLEQIYKVVYVPIIVVTSTLDDSQKRALQSIMNEIGGFISDEWTNHCTHMTVPSATITEKVTCAMVSAVPIVTMAYWNAVKAAVKKGVPLPHVEEFIPLMDEAFMGKRSARLRPNEKRKTLFNKLIFVIFSLDQYIMYNTIIRLAGGKAVLYEKGSLTIKELCAPNFIVLQYPDSSMSQSTLGITNDYDLIFRALVQNKRKMLPATEIPLAIWHCSIEKFCNPTFSFAKFLRRNPSSLPTARVLVPDTQDVTINRRSLPKIVSSVPLTSKVSKKIAVTIPRIIPDTYDDFSTQGICTIDYVNESEAPVKINEPRIIQETADTIADMSLAKESEQVPKTPSTSGNVYIPETNDWSFSNEFDENTDFSIQDIENFSKQDTANSPEQNIGNSSKQDIKMQESTKEQSIVKTNIVLKESMTENVVMSVKNLDSSVNEDFQMEIMNWDTDGDQNDNQLQCSILEKETKKSPVKLNTKTAKERRENCSAILQRTKESHKRTMRTSRSTSANDSDVEYIPFNQKGIRLENSGIAMKDHETTDNSYQETSSFLRNNSNTKQFNKVHNKIPKTRIALGDMYVWDR